MVQAELYVGVWRMQRVQHNKEQPKRVVEKYSLESTRLVETSKATSPYEKYQVGDFFTLQGKRCTCCLIL